MAGLATLHVKQVPPDYFARTPSQAKGNLGLDVCYVLSTNIWKDGDIGC